MLTNSDQKSRASCHLHPRSVDVYFKGTAKTTLKLPCSWYVLSHITSYIVLKMKFSLHHLSMNNWRSITLKQKDVCYSGTMLAEMGPSLWWPQQTIQRMLPLPLTFHWTSLSTAFSQEQNTPLLSIHFSMESSLTISYDISFWLPYPQGQAIFPKTNDKTFLL